MVELFVVVSFFFLFSDLMIPTFSDVILKLAQNKRHWHETNQKKNISNFKRFVELLKKKTKEQRIGFYFPIL